MTAEAERRLTDALTAARAARRDAERALDSLLLPALGRQASPAGAPSLAEFLLRAAR